MEKPKASRAPLEVEVKLAIQYPGQVRRKILKLGFKEEAPRALEQNWVLDFDDQALRRAGQLLRVREYQNQRLVTFKGAARKSRAYKVRQELETEVGNAETLLRILEQLGLETRFRYEKYRSTFKPTRPNSKREVLVTIDETPIGSFLEIEGNPKMIEWVASKLGFSPEQYITKSYTELFFASTLARRRKNMVFSGKF